MRRAFRRALAHQVWCRHRGERSKTPNASSPCATDHNPVLRAVLSAYISINNASFSFKLSVYLQHSLKFIFHVFIHPYSYSVPRYIRKTAKTIPTSFSTTRRGTGTPDPLFSPSVHTLSISYGHSRIVLLSYVHDSSNPDLKKKKKKEKKKQSKRK